MKLHVTRNVQADTESNELIYRNGEWTHMVSLEPITMKLLAVLVQKQGTVCTNEELINSVWDGNLGVGKSAIRKNIYKLREQLLQIAEVNLIETIPKKGYNARHI